MPFVTRTFIFGRTHNGGVKAAGIEDVNVTIEHPHAAHRARQIGAENIDRW
jgi:hypothetical protein